MVVSYKSVYQLVEQRGLVRKSLEGLINDCLSSFDSSTEKAQELEYFEYLQVMVNERAISEKMYVFFWDYRFQLPTTLIRDKDFTVEALAIFAFDYSRSIPVKLFRDLIQTTCDNINVDYDKILERFNKVYEDRASDYRLEHEKIQRNELCPCGSGSKYKHCHGKAVHETAK